MQFVLPVFGSCGIADVVVGAWQNGVDKGDAFTCWNATFSLDASVPRAPLSSVLSTMGVFGGEMCAF